MKAMQRWMPLQLLRRRSAMQLLPATAMPYGNMEAAKGESSKTMPGQSKDNSESKSSVVMVSTVLVPLLAPAAGISPSWLTSKAPVRWRHHTMVPRHGRHMPSPASVRSCRFEGGDTPVLLVNTAGFGKRMLLSEWPWRKKYSQGRSTLIRPRWTSCEEVQRQWWMPLLGVKHRRAGFCETSTMMLPM